MKRLRDERHPGAQPCLQLNEETRLNNRAGGTRCTGGEKATYAEAVKQRRAQNASRKSKWQINSGGYAARRRRGSGGARAARYGAGRQTQRRAVVAVPPPPYPSVHHRR